VCAKPFGYGLKVVHPLWLERVSVEMQGVLRSIHASSLFGAILPRCYVPISILVAMTPG
jgi:hypothetical protein